MRQTYTGRTLAAILIAAIGIVQAPVWAGPSTATLSGHVLSLASREPMSGVRVHVGDPKTGAVRTSAPTRADGSFSVAGIPPSAYQIAVQSGAATYVVDGSVRLAPGEARRVQLGVREQATGAPPDDTNQKRSGATWWNNPLTATLIVLGSAVLIGVIVDSATNDETENPSPSAP